MASLPRILLGLVLSTLSAPSVAGDCAGNPDALGTSRTINVKPRDFPLVGKMQYMETLRLRDREVVLTFDDGPMVGQTDQVLKALAHECVKATFFFLGINAAEYPVLAQRAYDEGHTIGYHTFSHPNVEHISFEKAKADINLGIAAVKDALGAKRRPAPFYRPPYLSMTKELERDLTGRGFMVWSIDADSKDWMALTTENALIARTLKELETAGRGIILMHDIQPVTARAMPRLLAELKKSGFRIVHVVQADERTSKVETNSGLRSNE